MFMLAALASCRPGEPPVTTPQLPKVVRIPRVTVSPSKTVPPSTPVVSPQIEPVEAAVSNLEVPTSAKGPLLIRVGLASDLTELELPCCDRRLTLRAGTEVISLSESIRVAPSDTLQDRAVYRLQVAALKDEQQAQGLAQRLTESIGQQADAIFDAGTDLYRVRVGRLATRAEAEATRGRLDALGILGSWVATEGGMLENPAFELESAGETWQVAGRWLEVSAPPDVGVPYGTGRYRGQLLVFLNDRGNLNIVNELELEDYLRGVVPKEMGPELYKQIEALKAQTLAARTYAVRNLSEFADEGFDICSTPRCQVYGGMQVEHPMSDQAISDTRGLVALFEGQPAETMYGATCGGHTENVEVVFPLKTGPYLRGVPCVEAGVSSLEGDAPRGTAFPDALMQRLLPVSTGKPAKALGKRIERLAEFADLPVPRDRLRSLNRHEVLRFAMSVFDLALDQRLRSSHEELEELVAEPPAEWRPRDVEFAGYLVSSQLAAEPGSALMSASDAEELLFRLAIYLEVLERRAHRYLSLDGGLQVRTARGFHRYELPGSFATFRRQNGVIRSAALEVLAGDLLELYFRGDDMVALVQPVDAPAVRFGHRVPKQSWSRFVSTSRLRSAVQARYPGFPFENFEVLSRGVSGRVGKLRLLGSDGRSLLVEGLAVRWTLDVWDTLFWAEPVLQSAQGPGWQFRGKGWGHGVGMCQAGAFGMAQRGATYREILGHYYSGIKLGRLKSGPARPRAAS